MPGVLIDESPADPALALPHSSPLHLLRLRPYLPVHRRSIMLDFCNDQSAPPQLSPLRCPSVNVNSLPEMHAENGDLLDPGLFLQLSPASTGQWGCNSPSPTTLSALSDLQQFLPSNFEEDGGNASQADTYSCDEFRMYEFKVRRCIRMRSHDWTECPFAHPGEKARRRDPRRFPYSGTACAEFRRGACKKGDFCENAHGVFECWLHPARYRTQPCKDGPGCRRRICFFAHTPDQLRLVSRMSSPSALSSPTSRHVCPSDAFELCGSSSSIHSPAKKASLESYMSPCTSSPLCRMSMEAPSDGTFAPNLSLIYTATLSPPSSSSSSPPNAHINWSPRGVSTFSLPASAMPHLHPSLHLNQTQASLSSVPAHTRHWERLNESLSLSIAQLQSGSKSILPLPLPTSTTSHMTTSTMQQVEDLMGLLKQADLTQEQAASFSDGNSMLCRGARIVPKTHIKMGCSEEEMLIGGGCDDEEEGEPKLERVESGKGLRAQIFESLLRSSQPSCSTYQDSNLEPLRSSLFLGF